MSVIATAVRHLLAAGVTGEALVQAIAEMESAQSAQPQVKVRTAGALRQERYRQRHKASQSVTCDGRDAGELPPPKSSPTPPKNHPPYNPPSPSSDEDGPPVTASPENDNSAPLPAEPDPDAPLTCSEIVTEWNEMARQCGLPTVSKLTDSRKRRLQARLRQYPEVEAWQRAFACIRGSPWMRGDNDRGWRADFDFLLQDKSFTKLTEGSYGQA